jgi:phage tail sheath gpL-like
MAEVQYDVIGFPYNDSTSLTSIENELADRWGPVRQNDGRAFSAKNDTLSNLATLGNARNSPHLTIMEAYKHPTTTFEVAAAYAATAAKYLNIDPARPLQTLELKGVLPPSQTEQFTMSERNTLLFDGIATSYVDSGGKVRIERAITTYKKNPLGATDPSYLDLTTMATLSYLRYDFRTYILNKYPRHKLANDGTRFGAGQAVMTPKLGKAEAIAKFRQWEELGLVEGFDQFKNDLIVERNASDVNRLDWYLSPDLINSLIVNGVQIGFLL